MIDRGYNMADANGMQTHNSRICIPLVTMHCAKTAIAP